MFIAALELIAILVVSMLVSVVPMIIVLIWRDLSDGLSWHFIRGWLLPFSNR